MLKKTSQNIYAVYYVCCMFLCSATGRQSHNTFNSEELRPLTSVTASWETVSHLNVEQDLEHPENNLWISEADDPNLDNQIVNAIVHGMCIQYFLYIKTLFSYMYFLHNYICFS